MLKAENITGDTWLVSDVTIENQEIVVTPEEKDPETGEIITAEVTEMRPVEVVQTTHKVAIKSGGTGDDAIAVIQDIASGDPVIPLDQLKLGAMRQVDQFHADLLERLTGNATVEEQMTWSPKAAAAKAVLAANAGPEQIAMLTPEATERGLNLADLANIIDAKNAEFHRLVGLAGSLRAKGHGLIAAAADAVALAAVIPQLQADANGFQVA